jgi:hypothetical protein
MRLSFQANKALGLRPRNYESAYRLIQNLPSDALDGRAILEWVDSTSFRQATCKLWNNTTMSKPELAMAKSCAEIVQENRNSDMLDEYDEQISTETGTKRKRGKTHVKHQDLVYDIEGKIACVNHPHCEHKFDDFPTFMTHLVEVIMCLPKNARQCLLCDHIIVEPVGRNNIANHVAYHFEGQIPCHLCAMRVHTKNDLNSHLKWKHPDVYDAPVQPSISIHAQPINPHQQLKRMLQSNHAVPEGTAIMTEASNKAVMNQAEYERSRDILRSQTVYNCSVCFTELPTLASIQNHMITEHPIIAKCGICLRLVKQQDWRAHQATHSPHVIICEHCKGEVPAESWLQHQRLFCAAASESIDTSKGPFACRVCLAEFTKLEELREHRVTHVESSMIMQFAKEAGFPTNLLTELFRATADPILIDAENEEEDSDVFLAKLGNRAEKEDGPISSEEHAVSDKSAISVNSHNRRKVVNGMRKVAHRCVVLEDSDDDLDVSKEQQSLERAPSKPLSDGRTMIEDSDDDTDMIEECSKRLCGRSKPLRNGRTTIEASEDEDGFFDTTSYC